MVIGWIQTLVHQENTIVNHKQESHLTFIDEHFDVVEKRELYIGDLKCYAISAKPKIDGDKVTVTKTLSQLYAIAS
ncbi:MAG: hypothetical protein ACRDAO_07005 [Culicoidibacterales bacterium]